MTASDSQLSFRQRAVLRKFASQTPPPADGKIRSTLNLGNPTFATIVTKFVVDLRMRLPEWEQLMLKEDWHAIDREAHRVKGTAGTLGFPMLTEPADGLVQAARLGNAPRAWSSFTTLRDLIGCLESPGDRIE